MSSERGLVYHVDDNEVTRYTIARILERGGYTVKSAGSGAELEAMLDRAPDIFILDIRLPDVSGLALTKRLKASATMAEVPVLLLSATFSVVERQVEGLSLGADAYLTHPAEPPVLLGTVEALLRARRAERAAREAQAERILMHAERALEQSLAQDRERAALVLDTVGDGIFLVDESGSILLWNRGAEQITGVASERAVGRQANELLQGLGHSSFESTRDAVEAVTIPIEVAGRELWLSVNRSATDEAAVYAFRDVTDEHRLERSRRDFIATVSHELRTPVTAIYGAAKTIERVGMEAETAKQMMSMIADQSERLKSLVENILTTTTIDTGRLELDDAAVPLGDVVEMARTSALVRDEGDHEIHNLLPPRPTLVQADRARLMQVVENLIENALKYSPSGAAVEIAAEERGECILLSVSDRGIGIPEPDRERVFEKFYRVDPYQLGGVGGSGLGLYITRALVEGMGGRVFLQSRAGGGTTFVVEMPRAA